MVGRILSRETFSRRLISEGSNMLLGLHFE